MYLPTVQKSVLAEELLQYFLDETKGHEVFFGKSIGNLYNQYDEFTADEIVRIFKNKLKEYYKMQSNGA